ncbi:MAG: hypothetical protein Q9204_005740 [Flavoplaca sp. TL-2023a]
MPSRSHTSKSSSISTGNQATQDHPVKFYESHLIFKSRWAKIRDNWIMEHKGERLKPRITGQPNDTALTIEDKSVVSDDGIPENQVERKAASKAYLTPKSDTPEDWQSITDELNSRRRREALQMKIKEYPLLTVDDVKIDFARSFNQHLEDGRSSTDRSSKNGHGRCGSSHSSGRSHKSADLRKFDDMTLLEKVRSSMNGQS